MSSDHPEIVIVRRRSRSEEEHHGGAWKIAFADFMTAMMAFFLVLWIISATDKNTKTIIARYFNPVKVEEPARSQKGIRAPEKGTRPRRAPTSGYRPPRKHLLLTVKRQEDPAKEPRRRRQPTPTRRPDPARPNPTMSEQELFSDPRASLDKIDSASPGPQIGRRKYQRVTARSDQTLTRRSAIPFVPSAAKRRQMSSRPTPELRRRRTPVMRRRRAARSRRTRPSRRVPFSDRRRQPRHRKTPSLPPQLRRLRTLPKRAKSPPPNCLPICGSGSGGELNRPRVRNSTFRRPRKAFSSA